MGLNTSIPYRSAGQTDPYPQDVPQKKFPLPPSCPIRQAAYAIDQSFMMLATSYPPAPFCTPASIFSSHIVDPHAASAILLDLQPAQAAGAGMVKAMASFAIVPGSWDDVQTITVTFPGWLYPNTVSGSRLPKAREVSVRFHYDYFVVDPNGVLRGGAPVTTPVSGSVNDSNGNAVTLVGSKTAIPIITRAMWLNSAPVGGAQPFSEVGVLCNGGSGYWATLPTITQYLAWCNNAAPFYGPTPYEVWTATQPPCWDNASTGTTFGQYVLANSRISDFSGPIVARLTTYALPE